ncbi:MAG: phosphotriesterase [Deltaproteobacteria bacterium]|nr:phosphotriesterase [Deltaproteobacteria bacterium]
MGTIMTVLGPIKPKALGLTSMHEHILYNGSIYRRRFLKVLPPEDELPVKPDDLVTLENITFHKQNFLMSWDACSMYDESVMTDEMADFKASGGSAMVDMSVPGLRSNLNAIRRISKKAGVHIVATTGLYSEDSWPVDFQDMSTDQYAAYMREEIQNGIEDTGIRAGHIKVAIETGPTEQGKKLLKAVAEISNETGLSASIHHGMRMTLDEIRDIMKILLRAGMDPSRTIMSHMQNSISCMELKKLVRDPATRTLSLDFNKEVLDQGFNVAHDCFGQDFRIISLGTVLPADWQNIAAIYELCRDGYAGQIVLATDTFLKILTRRFGGGGYVYLTTCVLPQLEQVGVAKKAIEKMTVENPARLLAGE